jgi:hypothetical protein
MAAGREPIQKGLINWNFVKEGADLSGVDTNHVQQGVDWEQGANIMLDDDAVHENLIAILSGDLDGSYRPENDMLLF